MVLSAHVVQAVERIEDYSRARSDIGSDSNSNATSGDALHEPSATVRILAVLGTTLSPNTGVHVQTSDGSIPVTVNCVAPGCLALQGVNAGASVTKLEMQVQPDDFPPNVGNAKLKVIDATVVPDTATAQSTGCGAYGKENKVAGNWGKPTGAGVTKVNSAKIMAAEPLTFKMGGSFRICYASAGSWNVGATGPDVTSLVLQVNGVYDPCTDSDCLANKRYECYLRKQAYNTANGKYSAQTSCVVDFSGVGAGFSPSGTAGKATWTDPFGVAGYDTNGVVQTVTAKSCGTAKKVTSGVTESFICMDDGACDNGDYYVDTSIVGLSSGKGRINIPAVKNELSKASVPHTLGPYTVAACYCASLSTSDCNAEAEFTQQVGILHFYLAKTCHVNDPNCNTDFTGSTPQYRFRIRVECPTNACLATEDNRIKIVKHDADRKSVV